MKLLRKLFGKKATSQPVKPPVNDFTETEETVILALAKTMMLHIKTGNPSASNEAYEALWEKASGLDRALYLCYAVDVMSGKAVRIGR